MYESCVDGTSSSREAGKGIALGMVGVGQRPLLSLGLGDDEALRPEALL